MTNRITVFDRPRHFRDEMVRGAFARIVHDRYFEPTPAGTRMRDEFEYAAPFSILGRIAERIVLTAYLRSFLTERAAVLKRLAESEEWREYVPPVASTTSP